ncbi:MAG TPA: glycosyltransferase [Pseudomonas sp.]|nr:glycosyltransferase [Pseudomonas sp.]
MGKQQSPDGSVCSVIGLPINALSWHTALSLLAQWSSRRESRYVCICNVHSLVTARGDAAFAKVIHEADMATPDGAPLAWMLRRLGMVRQERINGPDLMWRYCAEAAHRDESLFLFGGRQETLDALQRVLLQNFPSLRIAGAYSPPYRPLSQEEDDAIVTLINASGAGTVWVGLGCPKQELWMAAHQGRIQAAMIGVRAAFDYHAGTIRRAPMWMQRSGLEWFHRLCSEPRRLWKRYFVTNSLFIVYAGRQLLGLLPAASIAPTPAPASGAVDLEHKVREWKFALGNMLWVVHFSRVRRH